MRRGFRRDHAPFAKCPGVGTVAILSDGTNLCCYSSAIVGNVNRNSFVEIWNGPAMQNIRRELVEGRFPPECRSTSCPIFRGDEICPPASTDSEAPS